MTVWIAQSERTSGQILCVGTSLDSAKFQLGACYQLVGEWSGDDYESWAEFDDGRGRPFTIYLNSYEAF